MKTKKLTFFAIALITVVLLISTFIFTACSKNNQKLEKNISIDNDKNNNNSNKKDKIEIIENINEKQDETNKQDNNKNQDNKQNDNKKQDDSINKDENKQDNKDTDVINQDKENNKQDEINKEEDSNKQEQDTNKKDNKNQDENQNDNNKQDNSINNDENKQDDKDNNPKEEDSVINEEQNNNKEDDINKQEENNNKQDEEINNENSSSDNTSDEIEPQLSDNTKFYEKNANKNSFEIKLEKNQKVLGIDSEKLKFYFNKGTTLGEAFKIISDYYKIDGIVVFSEYKNSGLYGYSHTYIVNNDKETAFFLDKEIEDNMVLVPSDPLNYSYKVNITTNTTDENKSLEIYFIDDKEFKIENDVYILKQQISSYSYPWYPSINRIFDFSNPLEFEYNKKLIPDNILEKINLPEKELNLNYSKINDDERILYLIYRNKKGEFLKTQKIVKKNEKVSLDFSVDPNIFDTRNLKSHLNIYNVQYSNLIKDENNINKIDKLNTFDLNNNEITVSENMIFYIDSDLYYKYSLNEKFVYEGIINDNEFIINYSDPYVSYNDFVSVKDNSFTLINALDKILDAGYKIEYIRTHTYGYTEYEKGQLSKSYYHNFNRDTGDINIFPLSRMWKK